MNIRMVSLLLLATIAWDRAIIASPPPIDPDEARPHVGWQDAGSVVGHYAFVSGMIAKVRTAGRVTLLEFSEKKPPGFAAVIYADKLAEFSAPIADLYEGKLVRIRGTVTTYRGSPQIPISSPDQIELLNELPKSDPPVGVRQWTDHPDFKLAAFNVLNLYDAVDDPYRWDETTPPKPRKELEALAKILRKLNADVIALEEVENRGYLERFLEVFLPEMGYQYVVQFEGNDDRGIDVAVVSRIPVGTVKSNRHLSFPGPNGKPLKFARDLLQVTLKPTVGGEFQLWVVHLTSNFEGKDYAEPFRIAEAQQVRKMLDDELKLNPEARIIVAGDFNDTWESKTLQTVVGNGPEALWSAALDANGQTLITFNQQPYLSMIDFVLLSPTMSKKYVRSSFHIEPGSPELSGSDHNPVAVKFDMEQVSGP